MTNSIYRSFFSRLLIALLVFQVSLTANSQEQKPIKIFMAGDSMISKKSEKHRPKTGWGEAMAKAFVSEKVVVRNLGVGGRSTKSFRAEGRWDKLLNLLEPGNIVFIDFGHCDRQQTKEERYTTPEQFGLNLGRFVDETRAKQCIPVLFTGIVRRTFKDGKFLDTHGEYTDVVRRVAREKDVCLVDLHHHTSELLSELGYEASGEIYIRDHTHLSPFGALVITRMCYRAFRKCKKLKLHRQDLYTKEFLDTYDKHDVLKPAEL